ncbi:hypothetical protein [Phytohabitans aurantiacus]|nr:hypothetical protein [Phytohabitans aurantiacus]
MASLPILVAIGAGVPSGAGSVTGPGAPESALPFIALPPTGPVIVPPAPTPSDEPAAAHAAPGLPANRRPVKRDARRPGAIGKRPEQPRQPAPTESAPAPRPPVPTTLPPEPTHPPSHQPTPWWPPVPHPTLPQLPRPPHPPSHMPSWPALPGSLCPTP